MALSRSERAYELLRGDLLDNRWVDGTVLSAYALAEELAMSRTPVSVALKRLERDGLVEIVPQVGCRVVGRTAESVVEALRIRAALEGLAAESAAECVTEQQVRGLRALLLDSERAARDSDEAGCEEADRAFHEALVRIAGQPQLERLIRDVWLLNDHHLGQLRRRFVAARVCASLDEHRRIVETLEAHEPAAARLAAEGHLRAAAADFERLFRSEQAQAQAQDRAVAGL
ncbi:FCD domain-containing protein [Nocardia sp. R6R-6]|uniref:FCD domain-containing protein n=1 Tax=Nocardia sp. R6R-6 TaxID=3459303 RepID=UPI00403D5DA4